MTVADLLEIPEFSNISVLAGDDGLKREISEVTVIDTPDGHNWLSGKEFIITTAYMMKDDPHELTFFIQKLYDRGASGLGIKENRYLSELPMSALLLARRLHFPLLSIPEEYRFTAIINPVLTRIVSEQAQQLSQADRIHREFLDMAINDRSIVEILHALEYTAKLPCSFLGTGIECFYTSGDTAPLSGMHIDRNTLTADSLSGRFDIYPVANRKETFGYLLFAKDSLHPDYVPGLKNALEYAAIVIILKMQAQISSRQMEEKYRESFLEDLLLSNIKADMEVHNRARLYGWDFKDGGLAAVVDINNIKRYFIDELDPGTNRMLEQSTEFIFSQAQSAMEQAFPNVKCLRQSDLIAFILTEKPEARAQLTARLEEVFADLQARLLNRSLFTVTLGIGKYYDNIIDISKSYNEARVAINLGYSLNWFDQILFYDRLGIYRILAPMRGTPEADELYQHFIQPLIAADDRSHGELLPTLQAIVTGGWNLKEAAEHLYVHYNSLKYRYGKICRILGTDLSVPDNRSLVEAALRLYQLSYHKYS